MRSSPEAILQDHAPTRGPPPVNQDFILSGQVGNLSHKTAAPLQSEYTRVDSCRITGSVRPPAVRVALNRASPFVLAVHVTL